MSPRPFRLRSLLVPLVLIALAILMTVPWTYWVILAAYDRDIDQNAKMLARRVEIQVTLTPKPRSLQSVKEALQAELLGDQTVKAVVFCDVSDYPRYALFSMSQPGTLAPKFGPDEIKQHATRTLTRHADPDSFNITVPWLNREGRMLGFTYVELSRDALQSDFWTKEGPLLRRVLALTAIAIACLSGVGIIAYWTWRSAGRARQRAQLQQQGLLAERGLTAAVLAHEIRNPLAALRFQLHSLRKGASDPGRVNATAGTIDSELLRIQNLVTDYLEHEKAVTLRVTRVDLEEEARRLQTLMGEMLRAKGTRLAIVPPPRPVVVSCDPHALRQVLMNLVLNAQQAMTHADGADPSTPGKVNTITLTLAGTDSAGTIDVADTGPGIPDDMRERLFKPFQTSKSDGTGIGLALVKRFVDNFGGTVSVDSEPGRGTTFRLALPLAEQNVRTGTQTASPLSPSQPART
ncbi:MAG: sensor histidine kinase [Tepidisphaeraceae bacterium]